MKIKDLIKTSLSDLLPILVILLLTGIRCHPTQPAPPFSEAPPAQTPAPLLPLNTHPASSLIHSLLEQRTLEEKIGQLTLYTSGWDVTGPSLNENYRQELKDGR